MKVAFVTGGRDFAPTEEQESRFRVLMDHYGIQFIVHGDCPTGADRWAKAFAADNGIWTVGVPAPWKAFGKFAGPKRNTIATHLARLLSGVGHKPVAIVFPGGRGTADAAQKAKQGGFIMEVIGG
jgi:hypothetical protein